MKIVPVKFEDVAVGDTVYLKVNGGYKESLPYTIIAKHQGPEDRRQYIVIAFMGDTPRSYKPCDLGKEHTPVVKTVTMFSESGSYSTTFYNWQAVWHTHKITYNIVDGEVDCSSIKMEKL